MLILADENIPAVESRFASLGDVRRFSGRSLCSDDCAEADVLLVRSVTRVDEQLLGGSPVRFVGTATSGTDHIDSAFLQSAQIASAHAPGSNANSVVEYVLCAIAEVADTLERLLARRHRVGIVGYGVIGKLLSARLAALGVDHCIHDPWLAASEIPGAASLEGVLQCDVVTLHCELTDAQPWPSRHLLGAGELQQLKPGALLINASRGPVIDNQALSHCLEQREDLRVVLDVWEHEPAVSPVLLRQVEFGTPHIAGYSYDGKLLATDLLLASACSALNLPLPQSTGSSVELAPLALPAGFEDADLVRYLLRQRYDISRDDRALRAVVLAREPEGARQGFDELRRSYHRRRELLGATVRCASPGGYARHWVEALGATLAGDS